MNDMEIIEMYFRRDENAIRQTEIKHGLFCRNLAYNILQIHEDAEECVNDTYLKAWNSIPPKEPVYFKGRLGRVVRSLFRRQSDSGSRGILCGIRPSKNILKGWRCRAIFLSHTR